MKVTKEKGLKIKVKGSDADNLASALKKVVAAQKVAGFRLSDLTDEEIKVMDKLATELAK